MNDLLAHWLWIPLPARLAILFAIGASVGAVVNVLVATFGITRHGIGPWSPRPAGAPPRSKLARVPLIGWLLLRREERFIAPGFWIRPLAIELATAAAVAALYWFETEKMALVAPVFVVRPQHLGLVYAVHCQFVSHVILFLFMLAASVIDLDEQLIPDAITVPGALAGLALAVVWPQSHLPVSDFNGAFSFLHLASPNFFPPNLVAGQTAGLAVGLACYAVWCLGLLPRPWRTRRGYAFAVRLLLGRMFRTPGTWWIWPLLLVGSVAIAAAWWANLAWPSLLTALVGMFAGGLVIWLVRVIGTAVMQREAMGFGDVTLLAMIGAYLGWQPCLIIFFLAPFFGLLFGVIQLIARRENVLPYGPFLCLAAGLVIVRWHALWEWAAPAFALGWIVPAAILVSLVALGAMLALWKALQDFLWPQTG